MNGNRDDVCRPRVRRDVVRPFAGLDNRVRPARAIRQAGGLLDALSDSHR